MDFDPEVLANARGGPILVLSGDAGDEDFVAGLPLDRSRRVVSCLREPGLDRQLVLSLRRHGYRGTISVTAHSQAEGERLMQAGANEVPVPFHDAADHAARQISDALPPATSPRAAHAHALAAGWFGENASAAALLHGADVPMLGMVDSNARREELIADMIGEARKQALAALDASGSRALLQANVLPVIDAG